MHEAQEKVWDDGGRVQGKEEAEGASGVRGGVGGGGKVSVATSSALSQKSFS